MAAQPPAILYDPPLIRFRIDGRVAAERPLAALRRVIEVEFGSPLHGNDGRFDLMDFGDALWVISDDISLPTHKAWAQYLQGNRGYFKAQIFWPPKRWMTGGILGMLQSPGPRVAPPESIPTADFPWELQGPLDPAVFPPTPL
jgi:hypothetical protein